MPNLGVKLVREVESAREWVVRGTTGYINGKMTLVPSQALVFDLFRYLFILWVHIYAVYSCVRLILSVGPRGLPNNSLSAPEYEYAT